MPTTLPSDFVELLAAFAAAEVEQSAYARRINTEWDGVEISVMGREDLIASKRAAGRPQDLVDAASLEKLDR
jgi:hypothetical protein